MRPGARKENIERKSLTDEQRRRIAKGLQPSGLFRSGCLALLLLGRRALRLCFLVASRQPARPCQREPPLFVTWVQRLRLLILLFDGSFL
jgi:hypothetical protein